MSATARRRHTRGGSVCAAGALVAGLALLTSGCGVTWTPPADAATPTPTRSVTDWIATRSAAGTPSATAAADPAPTASASAAPVSPVTEPPPSATPTPTVRESLKPGDAGDDVLAMQKRLRDLGYWLGEPDGSYGGLTQQAVYAVQKVAGLDRDGVAGAATRKAIADGLRPTARVGGSGIEIDLAEQVILIVRDGVVTTVLNTSTGSNTPYAEVYKGETYRGDAQTPTGSFAVYHQVDKLDEGPLGGLWRPKYFNGGIAVHGAPFIPPYPASHGCARVSNEAMNMIWANDLMPMGAQVTVY